ncbi:MAG: SHD1 domain-containing protein [Planctomycetaceae bacterium]
MNRESGARLRRSLACLIALLIPLCMSPSRLCGQERLSAGQTVEVNISGDWLKGRVLRVSPDGNSVQVRVTTGRTPQTGVVSVDRVRLPGSDKQPMPVDGSGEARTWKDATGSFSVVATMVAVEGDNVRLKKSDGSVIAVPVSRLSPADQDYIAKQSSVPGGSPGGASGGPSADFAVDSAVDVLSQKKWYPAKVLKVEGGRYYIHYDNYSSSWDEWVGPERIRQRGRTAANNAGAENAFATNRVMMTAEEAAKQANDALAAAQAAQVQAMAVPDDGTSTICRLQGAAVTFIDPQVPAPSRTASGDAAVTAWPQGRVLLPPLDTFESVGGFLAADSSQGLALLAIPRGSPGAATTRFLWCDVKSGKVTKQMKVEGLHRLLAGDVSSGWLITLDPQKTKRATVWKWSSADSAPEPQYVLALDNPYPSAFANDFTGAWMTGADRAIIQTGGRRIVQWNLAEQRVERVWEGDNAAIQAGQLAVSDAVGIGLFDLSTGKQNAFLQTGSFAVNQLSLSPSGSSLACLASQAIRVYDLRSGAIAVESILADAAGVTKAPPLWIGERNLLVDHQYLLNLDAEFFIWQYTNRSGFRGLEHVAALGESVGYISEDQPALCSIVLPHAQAEQAVSRIDPRSVYAVTPGASVSLQAGGLSPEFRSALEKRIAEVGWKVVPSAPVTIVASVSRGQPQTASYREGLSGTGVESQITFTPTIYGVDIQVNGQSVWSAGSQSGLPMMIVSTSDQSAQDTVRKYETPDTSFFSTVAFPSRVVAPQFKNGLGKSELTSAGVASSP